MNKTLITLAAAVLLSAPAFARHATATTTGTGTTSATTTAASTSPAGSTSAGSSAAGKTTAAPAAPTKIINVNSASATDLTTIPGINAKIAADVIKNRPYKNADELVKKVKGIGPKNIKKMTAYISF